MDLKIIVIILSFTCFLFWNCSKNEEAVLKPRLFITVVDEAAEPVQGASVRLYKDPQDPGIIKTTDSTGIVLFDSLEPELYYWHAEKGCKTNANSQVTLHRALIPGVVLYGYSVLAETGVLKLMNTSADSLNVTDSLSLNIILNDTPYFAHPFSGNYKIFYERRNLPGIIKDTTIQVQCGDTSLLLLPF